MKSQNAQILGHLKRGKSLTPLQALREFNCLRLGARIYDLKESGHNIESTMIEINGKHVAQYAIK